MEKPERAHYRIVYPPMFRPSIIIDGNEYSIMNLSETGVKFEIPEAKRAGKTQPEFKQPIVARIKFSDGQEVPIEGKILRREPASIILLLTLGVPLAKIMSEQLYLIQRFKDLKT